MKLAPRWIRAALWVVAAILGALLGVGALALFVARWLLVSVRSLNP